jgi:glucuronosyltransferase
MSSTFSRSHLIPMHTLARALAERGHDITFVSTFPAKYSLENYRDIEINLSDEHKKMLQNLTSMFSNAGNHWRLMKNLPNFFSFTYEVGKEVLNSEKVSELKKESFDIVIVGYFLSDYLLGFADHFQCPSIVLFSAGPLSMLNKMVGNPFAPEGSPHFLISSETLNFGGRVKNLLINMLDQLMLNNYRYYMGKRVYE